MKQLLFKTVSSLAIALAALPSLAIAQAVPASALSSDPSDALGTYLRELSVDPRNLEALTGAGRAALAVGDPNAAVGFFARAEGIAPRDGRIKAGMGAALVQMQQPREALRLFDEALALGVPDAELASDRGLAFDLRGDNAHAQEEYQAALRAHPDDETLRRFALSKGMSGDRSGAIRLLDPLLRKQDRGAWRAQAFILAMTGDTRGATEQVRQLMPADQAGAMAPFMARLAALSPDQKAMAVHFGVIPSANGAVAAPPVYAAAQPTPLPPVYSAQPSPAVASNSTRDLNLRQQGAASIAPVRTASIATSPALPPRPSISAPAPTAVFPAPAAALPSSAPAPATASMQPAPVVPGAATARTASIAPAPRATFAAPAPAIPQPSPAVPSAAPAPRPGAVATPSTQVASAPAAPGRPVLLASAAPVPHEALGSESLRRYDWAQTIAPSRPASPAVPSAAARVESTARPTEPVAAPSVPPAPQTALDASHGVSGPPVPVEIAARNAAVAPVAPTTVSPTYSSEPSPGARSELAEAMRAHAPSAGTATPMPIEPPAPSPAASATDGGPLQPSAIAAAATPVQLAELPPSAPVAPPPAAPEQVMPAEHRAEPAPTAIRVRTRTAARTEEAADPTPREVSARSARSVRLASADASGRSGGKHTDEGAAPTRSKRVESETAEDEKPTARKSGRSLATETSPAKAKNGSSAKNRETKLADASDAIRKAKGRDTADADEESDDAPAKGGRAAKDSASGKGKTPKDSAGETRKGGRSADASSSRAGKGKAADEDEPPVRKSSRSASAKSDDDEADEKAGARKPARSASAKADKEKSAAKDDDSGAKGGTRHWVQVSGGSDQDALPKEYAKLKKKYPELLSKKAAYATPLNDTNRLLVGPFDSDEDAQAFVNNSMKKGLQSFTFTSKKGQKVDKLPTQ